MKATLEEYARKGMSREQAGPVLKAMAAREIQTSQEARKAYLDLWNQSGELSQHEARGIRP